MLCTIGSFDCGAASVVFTGAEGGRTIADGGVVACEVFVNKAVMAAVTGTRNFL
jgi:hypothetical protein